MSIGPWQIILILGLIFLLFGARRLPQIMRDLATGIRSFREGLNDSGDSEEKKPPRKVTKKK
ncbi:MAG: twin-arginine translocase TatA/TatE family subunit [Alphaproteobacteria bacterium GM202ARS2]|nr:twin-arginine translocase TatA/TatE family subunit [Alphaproteobacteria bacterium GM202ARS2]